MFASKTLTEHLLRGVVGLTALVLAVVFTPSTPLALLLFPLALLALRGCPTCWAVGLAQTLWAAARGKQTVGGARCVGGACALRAPAPGLEPGAGR